MGHRVDTSRAHWKEATADGLQDEVSALVGDLMRESVKLGRTAASSKEYKAQRARVALLYRRVEPALAQLRTQAAREAKRSTRDALHARLCEIERNAAAHSEHLQKPFIAWKQAIDQVITWLDSWTK